MVTSEERLKILRMIQEGKISAEQGIQLLEALEGPKTANSKTPESPLVQRPAPRWFRVRVTDLDTGKVRVNVRLPVNVLNAGFKMGARFAPEVEGLDVNQLQDLIRAGEMGKIVDVYDEEDGEHVEVFLE